MINPEMSPNDDAAPRALEMIDDKTTVANSAVVLLGDRSAIVQLDPDHPGFRDAAYRARRNAIAQIGLDHRPGSQVPEVDYTAQDHAVWQEVWRSLKAAHAEHACKDYLEHAKLLALPHDRIPQLWEVSERTQELSGFRLEPVAGLVHPKVFLSTLGDDVFLSTQYIRHHSTPLYTPEPDVVHELIGHAAMLASERFTKLTRLIGKAAKSAPDDEALERLGRVYWFTIEFGVLREAGALKAYGAGLLSSAGELQAMHQAELRPFDIAAMEAQDYDVTQYQPLLYCADSFEEMVQKLSAYYR
ncbi:MAG: phenylalanine 4-monooxygenase [Deltaproteobacteria bacterium]|nr:phenylalanine 4-monooxygenase [Deltaproteobacteria bacterium]